MNKKTEINISILFLSAFVFFAFQIVGPLTPSEKRGELIYTQGSRSSGKPITAQLSGAEFDAKILPCINCHGRRGEGNPEGGIHPSPLDWASLTKPYIISFENGRKRMGYDQDALQRAIVEGIDPSENKLDLVMPRYTLDRGDINDLVAYLKIIDKLNINGVTDSSIHVGVILPSRNRPIGRSDAILKTMLAYLNQLNSGGGIYNRKIELQPFFEDDLPDQTGSSFEKYISEHDIFAFIGSDLTVLPPDASSILEKEKIPVVGIIKGEPVADDYLKNNFFFLFSGIENEIINLVKFARDSLGGHSDNFVILYDSTALIDLHVLEKVLPEYKSRIVVLNTNDSELRTLLTRLKADGIENCLYLGDTQVGVSFLSTSQKIGWFPNILTPGKMASSSWMEASLDLDGKIYFSYTTWMSERSKKGMQQYQVLASKYDLESAYLNAQLNTLASAILFTEAIKLTGKEMNRASLLNALKGLRDFETGFISPLTFGPNRRVGSEKVFVVQADLKNKSLRLKN